MTTAVPRIRLAFGDDFLDAFSRLQKNAQKQTRRFIDKFRENPTNPSLNYEIIKGARDPNLRSVRVDQNHRAVVHKPDSGNTYIILWVDKHDSAYEWAQGRVYSINPSTGVLQVMDVQKAETPQDKKVPVTPDTTSSSNEPGKFDPFTDEELTSIGVPESSILAVRKVTSDEEFDALEDLLPPDAFEALFHLAIGESLEDTRKELGLDIGTEVDTSDFAAALDRESSRRRFIVISDTEEMEKILSYPLDKWRVFLHPSQKRLVRMNARGPVRVLGGAGTGKTVVAIHRAKWLVENVCKTGEKVLFTFFTRNLVHDIERNLQKLCSHDVLKRIEVVNLDAWANRVLAGRNNDSRVDFTGRTTAELWQEALASTPTDCPLTAEELDQEWKYVVQAQGVRDLATYIRVGRAGMGKPLSRPARKQIWPVFEDYISLLKEARVLEPIDAIREARQLIETQKLVLDYRAVVIDEAQDFSAEAFRLANAIVPEIRAQEGNHLFIVGDAHQRLYGHKVVLSHCGINIRGRSRKLKINYRTSEETRNWAAALLTGCAIDDLDGGLDEQKDYRSLFHGEAPLVEPGDDAEEQLTTILGHIENLRSQGASDESICIVSRTRNQLNGLKTALASRNLATHEITARSAEEDAKPGIRMATMHRVKGIEFDHMILTHMEASAWRRWIVSGPEGNGTLEVQERSLLYVAATRARKSVLVTSAGRPIIDVIA